MNRQWRSPLLALVAAIVTGGASPPENVGPPEAGAARAGRVVLVTGSTGGLGREVARRLAASGDHVIVHGRNRERGQALVREIEESGVGSAAFYAADFASLDNVRGLAAAVRRDYDRLDVLVNNAGILASPNERPLSDDGYELHFQVNYLSGFLLTHLLLPLLEESAPSRIVNVSSRSSSPLDFENIMLERGYSTSRAYGQSKLAQVMFTIDLAERLEGTGVTVNAVHPATLMDTDLVRDFGMRPRTSVEEGAEAVLHLIDAHDIGSGHYYHGLERGRARDQAYDAGVRARLWRLSEELTGTAGQEAPAVDTTGLGSGPYARMSMLLEKTIFQVDVLTLEVRLGERETAALARLLSGIGPDAVEEPALSDSIASVALGARDAWARIEFLRGVSLGRFLDGIRDNLREAEEAGIISSDRYAGIASDLPRWYGFLETRGIRDGDRMFYRIRGDTLHTVYTSESGERLLDQVDVGPDRRLAVLGGYFAPGSDFRGELVESVLRERRGSGS